MMPPTIECLLTRDLVQSVRPGESIIVTGVLRGIAASDTTAGAYGSMSGGGNILHARISESLEAGILMNRVIDVLGIQTMRTGSLRVNQQTEKILAKFARRRAGLTPNAEVADLELSFISSRPASSCSESSTGLRCSASSSRLDTSFYTTRSSVDNIFQTRFSIDSNQPLVEHQACSLASSQRDTIPGRSSEFRAPLRDFSAEDMQLIESMKADDDIFPKLVG